jgi:signal transduction histidine kinase
MFTDTPHFVLIGRNSANLDNFRREISVFEVSFQRVDAELFSQKHLSGIFFELEDQKDVSRLLELTKIQSLNSNQMPIIVIFDPLKHPTLPSIINSAKIRPVHLLKRPLLTAEIGQEVKNILLNHAQEAERLKKERLAGIRQFISGLSHEMGNILLRIMGAVDLAMMEDDVKQIHKRLEGVQRASERARSLVRNLQVFAKTSPQVSRGHLSQSLESALILLAEPLLAKNVTVKREGLLKSPSEEPEVVFDSAMMKQVFYNLIENALYAVPEAGGSPTLLMSIQTQSTGLEVKIIDDGAGIAPDTLKRVFDVGFSTHKDTAAGLGLPISREFVLNHGGSLHIKSTVGMGTEISIWLPLPTC